MALDERLALGDFYGGVENQLSMIRLLRQQSNEISGYLDRDSLDPQEAHALIRLSAQVRSYLRVEARNIPGLLAAGRRLGADAGPAVPDREAQADAALAPPVRRRSRCRGPLTMDMHKPKPRHGVREFLNEIPDDHLRRPGRARGSRAGRGVAALTATEVAQARRALDSARSAGDQRRVRLRAMASEASA